MDWINKILYEDLKRKVLQEMPGDTVNAQKEFDFMSDFDRQLFDESVAAIEQRKREMRLNPDEVPVIKIKKLHPDAVIPTRAHDGDAGWDVYALTGMTVDYGRVANVPTGITLQIPRGYRVSARPRSGLAFKQGITLINSPATIDEPYRGEIRVGLIKLTPGSSTIKKGDRIAQICLEKVEDFVFEEVDELEETERGDKGFGSTDV